MSNDTPTVRLSDIQYGDDLRTISLRELGTADRWVELSILNGLTNPYIAAEAAPGILAYGDLIKIPTQNSMISAATDPAGVYGVDIKLTAGSLSVTDGEIDIVAGVQNLVQTLRTHVVVDKQELGFHPTFGCLVRTLIGNVNRSSADQLAAFYVKSALLEDPRVQEVPSCTATSVGDQIQVVSTVYPIAGRPVDLSVLV